MNGPVVRPFARFIRWLGVGTVLTLALLLVALSAVALGLADLIRGLEASLLLPVAMSGLLLGWTLAKSPLPGWLAGIVGLVVGTEALVLHLGRLGRPLTTLLGSLAEFAWGILRWPLDGPPARPPVTPALSELETHLSSFLTRVHDWALAVLRGEAAFDPVAAVLVWGLVSWVAFVWAGWAVHRREQSLHALTPAGLLLAIGLSYTWEHPYPLWILLGATLLLMMLTGHIARERRWQAAGIDFSPELRLDLAMVAIGLSLTLLAAAILAPSISVRPVFEFAEEVLVEHLSVGKQVADSMGLEALAGPGIALSRLHAAGLPNQNLIGSGPELSEQMVMVVGVEGNALGGESASDLPDVPPSFYWRALTYDQYTGRGWRTGKTGSVAYQAGEAADLSAAWLNLRVHRTLRQEVRALGDLGGLLYRAGELVTADQDYRVAWRSAGDAFGAEIDARTYRADSLLPVVSEARLRAAGENYPDEIRDRYLGLPPDMPQRVLSLAQDLTAGERTPYDQVRAIETYLRAFTYTLDLPAPPPNRDVADYFLFELQQGYCDYYATTMAVLARAAGRPARLVVGYIGGAFDRDTGQYLVTAADAHSWVEVYFPDLGWVEFEPTTGRAAIERPAELTPLELPDPQAALKPKRNTGLGLHKLLWPGLLGGPFLFALGAVVWWIVDGWRLKRLAPMEAVITLYRRLYRHGQRLAVMERVGRTPHEFAGELTGRLAELAHERGSDPALPSFSQGVHWLIDLYVRGLYSPHEPSAAEKARAIETWGRLRQRLWLVWVRQRLWLVWA
jgi:transglutaminase-like putative cysteine protease